MLCTKKATEGAYILGKKALGRVSMQGWNHNMYTRDKSCRDVLSVVTGPLRCADTFLGGASL